MFKVLLAIFFTSSLYSDIYIEGSSTINPIIKIAAKEFKNKTGIKVHVKGGGSHHGIKMAMENKVDFGAVSRALHPHEKIIHSYPIGYDGIAIIVNPKNDIENLSYNQIQDIFSGKITHLNQIGSKKNNLITLVAKEQGRSTKELFDKYFKLKKISPLANIIGPNVAAVVLVASEPSAIGYVSIGSTIHAKKYDVNIKTIKLNGVIPNHENILNKSYPLRRELNLVTNKEPSDEALKFLNYLRSDDGQNIIKTLGFLGIK